METIYMKCQSQFSGKKNIYMKNIINLLSAELVGERLFKLPLKVSFDLWRLCHPLQPLAGLSACIIELWKGCSCWPWSAVRLYSLHTGPSETYHYPEMNKKQTFKQGCGNTMLNWSFLSHFTKNNKQKLSVYFFVHGQVQCRYTFLLKNSICTRAWQKLQ